MNITNMTALANFFDAGAPEIEFDMNAGLKLKVFDRYARTACGTAACIGGAAFQMANGGMTDFEGFLDRNEELIGADSSSWDAMTWNEVAPRALAWLGLQSDPEACSDPFFLHPLFDADLAPENCTTKEASDAIRRVIAGQDPWSTTAEPVQLD